MFHLIIIFQVFQIIRCKILYRNRIRHQEKIIFIIKKQILTNFNMIILNKICFFILVQINLLCESLYFYS